MINTHNKNPFSVVGESIHDTMKNKKVVTIYSQHIDMGQSLESKRDLLEMSKYKGINFYISRKYDWKQS